MVIILILLFAFRVTAVYTVSGISSGAFQAVQINVAFSSRVNGVGVVAGGPYWCAKNNAQLAVNLMTNPNLIDIPTLVDATSYAYNTATIDNPSNLRNTKAWLFGGSLDSVVVPGVVKKTQDYYAYYGASISTVYNIAAQHAFVTTNYGNSCNYLGSPYINNCGYDTVGNMWRHMYGSISAATTPVAANLKSFNQNSYASNCASCVSLAATGYVYIPNGCGTLMYSQDERNQTIDKFIANDTLACRVHVALHGCSQNYAAIGNAFVANAGYNGYAERNQIIVVYPQTIVIGTNPNGCFDWWGYTGSNYATKGGGQLAAINRMATAYGG